MSLPKSPFKKRITVGNETFESCENIDVVEVSSVTKNIQRDKKGNIKFTNRMKKSVLQLYVSFAKNPLVTRRTEMAMQCKKIWENCSIDLDGDSVRLNQIAFNHMTLGDIFYRRGKNGDKNGLSFPIFQVV